MNFFHGTCASVNANGLDEIEVNVIEEAVRKVTGALSVSITDPIEVPSERVPKKVNISGSSSGVSESELDWHDIEDQVAKERVAECFSHLFSSAAIPASKAHHGRELLARLPPPPLWRAMVLLHQGLNIEKAELRTKMDETPTFPAALPRPELVLQHLRPCEETGCGSSWSRK